MLQFGAEAADQSGAAGEDHVVADPALVLGFDAGDQVEQGLAQRLQQALTGATHRFRDVDSGRLAAHRHVDDDRGALADEGVAFLPSPHHVDGHGGVGIALLDQSVEVAVHRVPGGAQGALIVLGREAAHQDAEVRRAGADVDDHRVNQGIQPVGDGERLGDDHRARDLAGEDSAQVLAVDPERLRGYADDGMDRGRRARPGGDRQLQEPADELAHCFLVLVRPLLDQAPLQRPAQVEHGAVFQRFGADQHVAPEDLPRHHVAGPADVALHHVSLAVRRRDRAPRRPQVDADLEDFAVGRGAVHGSSSASKGAELTVASASPSAGDSAGGRSEPA